jgi:LysR family cyn operon transcriptional activator
LTDSELALELRHIRYFIRAAELLHFTRAAQSLYVSQPTLSTHIQQLEEELGAVLFERAGRHARPVRLTEAGHRFLKHMRSALRELELGKEDVEELRGLVSGTLRFGATHVFGQRLVSTALALFTVKYPEIHIVMKLGTSSDIEEAILERDIDVGLAFLPPDSSDIEYEALFSDEVVLVVSKKHSLAGKTEIPIHELSGLPCALPSSGFSTRRLLDIHFTRQKISPKILLEINDIPALLTLVERGGLATLVSRKAIENRPELCAISITGARIMREAGILKHQGVYLSAAARAFVELVKLDFTTDYPLPESD